MALGCVVVSVVVSVVLYESRYTKSKCQWEGNVLSALSVA